MTKRGLVHVTQDTDAVGFALDTDITGACLPGALCWRGGWCPDGEDEYCTNERAVVKDAARRESSSAAAEQLPVPSARRRRNRHNGVR